MTINTNFQVIIMGANYAGLAAAGELRGKRVLLLDRNPIGGHQASTCAMWKNNVEALDAGRAVLQTLYSKIRAYQASTFVPSPFVSSHPAIPVSQDLDKRGKMICMKLNKTKYKRCALTNRW